MVAEQVIAHLYKNPKKLFLIDGIGAIVSAFFLGIVLVQLEHVFGIPESTLYILAAFPVFFAIFDFYCYQKESDKLKKVLKIIACMNLFYSAFSID